MPPAVSGGRRRTPSRPYAGPARRPPHRPPVHRAGNQPVQPVAVVMADDDQVDARGTRLGDDRRADRGRGHDPRCAPGTPRRCASDCRKRGGLAEPGLGVGFQRQVFPVPWGTTSRCGLRACRPPSVAAHCRLRCAVDDVQQGQARGAVAQQFADPRQHPRADRIEFRRKQGHVGRSWRSASVRLRRCRTRRSARAPARSTAAPTAIRP